MSSGITKRASHVGKQAVVIGGGISGLAAASALADHFDEVVVLESDQLPTVATPRPGAPQGKQVHGLLGGAIKALDELFPDFVQDLANAGAVRVNPGSEILQEMPYGHLPIERLGLVHLYPDSALDRTDVAPPRGATHQHHLARRLPRSGHHGHLG